MPTDGEEAAPEQIDRYQVIEEIGGGAMGVVYRVHDHRFACDRALKILREELVGKEEEAARFRDEGRAAVRAAGDLAHPNIVTVYDVGEHEGRPFIVMELFRGQALDAVMERGEPLPVEQVLRIGTQLASALHSAHEHGVVHRDIKPGNILVSPDGQLAKLTDFSVAKLKRPGGDKTIPGLVIGAPRYMSPEQALGKTADGRSDLYGLGVVLYELLTNNKAFRSETITALLLEITQETPPPPRSLNPEVPPSIDRIVCRLLEKDPDKRFQSGREVEEAMRRELQEHRIASASERRIPSELIGAVALGIGVAIIMGIAIMMLQSRQREALIQQAAEIGSSYTETLAQLFRYNANLGGDVTAAEFIYQGVFENFTDSEQLAYQRVVNTDGFVTVSTSVEEVSQPLVENPVIEILSDGGDGTVIALVEAPMGQVVEVRSAIKLGDQASIGTYYVGLPTDFVREINGLTGLLMGIVTLLVAVLVGLVSFFLIRRLSAPLKRIQEGLLRLANEDLDVRMPATGRGLVREAFSAFNDAADSLVVMQTKKHDQIGAGTSETDQPGPSEISDPVLPGALREVGSPSSEDNTVIDDRTRIFVRDPE